MEKEIEAIEREKQEFLKSDEGKKEEMLNYKDDGKGKDEMLDIF